MFTFAPVENVEVGILQVVYKLDYLLFDYLWRRFAFGIVIIAEYHFILDTVHVIGEVEFFVMVQHL